jgi:tetratricopeptide (TPR) repeat protein
MMSRLEAVVLIVILAFTGGSPALAMPRKKHGPSLAKVLVHDAKPGCKVDLDGTEEGETNNQGSLTISDVDPSDHYLHVDCPGQPEATYFVSPEAGETAQIEPQASAASDNLNGISPAAPAANSTELRGLVREAVDLRGEGQFPEAIQRLRQAIRLDPANPDLHHELGVTFLMIRDWDRARVELLEAIRHEPNNADAHNGLGYALEKLGEIRPALDQFRIATHLDPSDDSYRQHYMDALGMLAMQEYEKKKKKK